VNFIHVLKKTGIGFFRIAYTVTNAIYVLIFFLIFVDFADCSLIIIYYFFLKIGIVGGEVQLGPFGTAATNRPIVPAPGDYDDGEIGRMMIGRGDRSTRRKPTPVPLCPPQTV
jgi:hypothetical protein